MEKRKNKGMIIGFLIGLLVAAVTFFILYYFKIVSFDVKNDATGKANDNKEIVDNKQNNVENIDEDILKELLPIIGLDKNYKTDTNCDFSIIFIKNGDKRLDSYDKWQAYNLFLVNYHQKYGYDSTNYEKCIKPGDTVAGGNCFEYPKERIPQILDLYDFSYTQEEIFEGFIENGNNYYRVYDNGGFCAGFDSYKHNISSWYGIEKSEILDTKEYITVRDKIELNYENGDSSSSIIYYTFKLVDGRYKLWLYSIY